MRNRGIRRRRARRQARYWEEWPELVFDDAPPVDRNGVGRKVDPAVSAPLR